MAFGPYAPIIDAAAARYRLLSPLLAGLLAQESGFNPKAVGDNGASVGMGQFNVKGALADFGLTREQYLALSPEQQIDLTAKFYAQKIKQAGGDPIEGLRLYNGGGDPKYVEHVLSRIPGDQRMNFAPQQEQDPYVYRGPMSGMPGSDMSLPQQMEAPQQEAEPSLGLALMAMGDLFRTPGARTGALQALMLQKATQAKKGQGQGQGKIDYKEIKSGNSIETWMTIDGRPVRKVASSPRWEAKPGEQPIPGLSSGYKDLNEQQTSAIRLRDQYLQENQPDVTRLQLWQDVAFLDPEEVSNNGAMAQALIVKFAAMNDPKTGVLSGEADAVKQALAKANIPQDLIRRWVVDNKLYPNEVRDILREMQRQADQSHARLMPQYANMIRMADRYQINPQDVVGETPTEFWNQNPNAFKRVEGEGQNPPDVVPTMDNLEEKIASVVKRILEATRGSSSPEVDYNKLREMIENFEVGTP